MSRPVQQQQQQQRQRQKQYQQQQGSSLAGYLQANVSSDVADIGKLHSYKTSQAEAISILKTSQEKAAILVDQSKAIVNNDNFVKLNLKNRGGSCKAAKAFSSIGEKQKRWKVVGERREQSRYSDFKISQDNSGNISYSRSIENKETIDNDHKNNHHYGISTVAAEGQCYGGNERSSNSGGFTMGIDILQMSLDTIQMSAKNALSASNANANSNSNSSSNSTLSSSCTFADNSQASKAQLTEYPTLTLSILQARARTKNSRYGGFEDKLLQERAPLCSGHQECTKLVKVNKSGLNKVWLVSFFLQFPYSGFLDFIS